MVLGFLDGNFGIIEHKLVKHISEDDANNIIDLLNTFKGLSLISSLDGVIRINARVQDKVIEMLRKTNLWDGGSDKLIEAYQNNLSSDLIIHASKTWIAIGGDDKQLIKKYISFPEVIGSMAKSSNKLETVTEFLRKSIQLLIKAYQDEDRDQDNLEILRLKMLLARYSLLPKGKVNEAINMLKDCADQCGSSPRGLHLGVKLRALIELGKVQLRKGRDVDKAVIDFQNIQVLASQKLATFEVDSDPNLLECRVLLGHAHYLSDNFGESKKIILEVIPLLSRKVEKGREDKVLINQAKFILGSIFRKTGDLANALMLQMRVLEEREQKLFGKGHPESWVAKLEMSYLYSQYDNHDKAMEGLRELLERQEEVLGAPTNLWSLRTMKAIAEVEGKRGCWEEALELWEAIDLILEEMEGWEVEGIRMECQLEKVEVLMNLGQYKNAVDILDLLFSLKISEKRKISGGGNDKVEEILRRRGKCEKSLEILGGYWLSLEESENKLEGLAKKHEAAVQLSDDNQDHWGR